MFEREFKYFVAHQDELVAAHRGKVLVIQGERVAGAYASPLEAYQAASRSFKPGTFMLQPCEPGREAFTVTIAADASK